MPFYYFHINNEPDSISFHADDLGAAKCEATKMAGQIICDEARTFWNTAEWVLTATDADGLTQFQLQFIGTDAPINLKRAIFASQEAAEIKEMRYASAKSFSDPRSAAKSQPRLHHTASAGSGPSASDRQAVKAVVQDSNATSSSPARTLSACFARRASGMTL